MSLPKIISDGRKDTDFIKPLFGQAGSPVPWFMIKEDTVNIMAASVEINTRSLGSSFILGHPGLGWLGAEVAGSAAVGSQPYLGDSRGAFSLQQSGDTMVFTTIGLNKVRDFLANNVPSAPSHIHFGSDATAATSGDTALGSVIDGTVRAFESVSSGADFVTFEGLIPSTAPSSQPIFVREIGVFDGSPTGSLWSHSTFTGVEKTENLELQGLYTIKIE